MSACICGPSLANIFTTTLRRVELYFDFMFVLRLFSECRTIRTLVNSDLFCGQLGPWSIQTLWTIRTSTIGQVGPRTLVNSDLDHWSIRTSYNGQSRPYRPMSPRVQRQSQLCTLNSSRGARKKLYLGFSTRTDTNNAVQLDDG